MRDDQREDLQTAEPQTSDRPPSRAFVTGKRGLLDRLAARSAREPVTVIDDGKGSMSLVVPRSRPSLYLLSFIFFVVIPALLVTIYFAFIASNQFAAETRFAVRTAQTQVADDKNGVSISSSIPDMAGQDAYIIASYIHSRAILDDLSKQIDIRAIFQRPEADFWARLKNNASDEALLQYWNGMVSAYVDAPSGVVTVTVRAFRPEDALLLSNAIVEASETLANDVSARARADATKRAEAEVQRADGLVLSALADLRNFRDKEGYIDPVAAATATGTLLSNLLAQKISLQNDLFVETREMSADAPTLQASETRMQALDHQIDQLQSKLTGSSPEGRTIAASLSTFEQLDLKRQFAEKLYSIAEDQLESARVDAERQNIFVSVFDPPGLPQEAQYPQRFSLSIIFAIALAIIWGILAMTAAVVDDHRY